MCHTTVTGHSSLIVDYQLARKIATAAAATTVSSENNISSSSNNNTYSNDNNDDDNYDENDDNDGDDDGNSEHDVHDHEIIWMVILVMSLQLARNSRACC